MSDLSTVGGIETWLKETGRTLRTLEGGIGKARVPRTTLSTLRPDPAKFQPGYRLFETDTARFITCSPDSSVWITDGVLEIAELTDLPAKPAVGQNVKVTGPRLHLYWNGVKWKLDSHPQAVRDVAARDWLSSNGLAFAGMRLYVIGSDTLFRWDGSAWQQPGIPTKDLDYGVMKASGRGRPMDAPGNMTTDGTINGDWNLVYEPGVYRVWGGNANGNLPANAYPFGTLVVFGAGVGINSRTQVYYPHSSGGTGMPFQRTAWNSNDWQPWTRSSYHLDIADIGRPGAVRDWDGDWFSRVSRDGNTASLVLGLSVNSGSSLSAASSNNYIGLIPEGYRPHAQFATRARVYVGSQGSNAWSNQWFANLYIYKNGQIVIGECNPASMGSDCLISGSWSYPTP